MSHKYSIILVFLIGACSSDVGGDKPDAQPIAVDASPPQLDAVAPGPAANLGASCSDVVSCPCIVATGRCTIPCPALGTIGGCDDGYLGPGFPYCGAGGDTPFCIIGCGEQAGGDLSCPHEMTCKDVIDNNGEPDICSNP